MRMGHREGEGRSGRRGGPHGPQSSRGFHGGRDSGGAQTFRRGRILLFLEQLKLKRATLARQLTEPEFETIRPTLSGELKALDQVIEEYIHLFDLQEIGSSPASRDPADGGEENG
ncbi:hypothetical protein [Cohnella hongkongensis]|uniref:Uncharacterized protein n=1 Tax=Cohnella hongkongensis TaxID=178337 RepID=A0ABV9FGY4_9BACL